MTGHVIKLKGFDFDKHGKLIRKPHRQSVSERLRWKHSKRIKVVRATPR